MKVFVRKLIIFLSPLILLLAVYVYIDPFKVFKHYDSYYESMKPNYVFINKEHASVENFKSNYPKYQYDSYIFGNSRSFNFRVDSWKKHINSDKIYHFDASKESLFGIAKKFEFLDKRKLPIKNAMIVLDSKLLAETGNWSGHLFVKHPEISGENVLAYHFEFIKAFFSWSFLYDYFNWKLTGAVGSTLDGKMIYYNSINNEFLLKGYDEEMAKDTAKYYLTRKNVFYKRSATEHIAEAVLGAKQKELLTRIKAIADANHTDLRIIISPTYDQEKFNPSDYLYMDSLFGKGHVFDFSGINDITNDVHNYYEYSHYRPEVADKLMDVAYAAH